MGFFRNMINSLQKGFILYFYFLKIFTNQDSKNKLQSLHVAIGSIKWMVVSQVCVHLLKLIVHLKWVHFISCKLYINKVNLKSKANKNNKAPTKVNKQNRKLTPIAKIKENHFNIFKTIKQKCFQ